MAVMELLAHVYGHCASLHVKHRLVLQVNGIWNNFPYIYDSWCSRSRSHLRSRPCTSKYNQAGAEPF